MLEILFWGLAGVWLAVGLVRPVGRALFRTELNIPNFVVGPPPEPATG